MPAALEPIRAVKCTYKDCSASFNTVSEMRRHKKYSKEHDYCKKCDEDFDNWDEYILHKAFRPDNHGMACRVCGEEFKSLSGMKRHVSMLHRIDQDIKCIGCKESFPRASLLTQHLEFGGCKDISPHIFHGAIVHKFLVQRLLDNQNGERDRFYAKIAKHDAAYDTEETGGVRLEGPMFDGDEECKTLPYKPMEVEVLDTATNPPIKVPLAWPELPSKARSGSEDTSTLASSLQSVSLIDSRSSNVSTSTPKWEKGGSDKEATPNAWKQEGKANASTTLFPGAKGGCPFPSGWTVPLNDAVDDNAHGVNIFKTRFWDPTSADYKPERFYEPGLGEYYCPFICEQTFDTAEKMKSHIMGDHRITAMRCPRCQKMFHSATALITHCETGSSKCGINHAEDFAEFLDRLSGGFLGAREEVRPDHTYNPTVMVPGNNGVLEKYVPPTVGYVKYEATKPIDWKEPEKVYKVDKRPM